MTPYERQLLAKFYAANPELGEEAAQKKLADVKEANRILAWATVESAYILARGNKQEAIAILRDATPPDFPADLLPLFKELINTEFVRLGSKRGFILMCKNAKT